MLARCARCQGTFTTDHYGRQSCPHCGSELILADPSGQQPPPPAPPPEPGAGDAWGAAPTPPGPDAGATPPGLPPPPPAGGGWVPPPPPPGPPPGDVPSPFADRQGQSFLAAFFDTWKRAAVEPQAFFARLRIDQLGPAILFGVLAAWVGGAVQSLLGLVANMSSMAMMQQFLDKMPPEQQQVFTKLMPLFMGGGVAVRIIALPLAALLGMFIGTAVIHVVLLMFKGGARGFGATLTVVAYSYGIHLLDAVPGCGGLVAVVWQAVILIIGLAAIHRTQTWKSAVAVLGPGVLCCCCVCVSFGSILGAIGAAKHAADGTSTL